MPNSKGEIYRIMPLEYDPENNKHYHDDPLVNVLHNLMAELHQMNQRLDNVEQQLVCDTVAKNILG